MADASEVVVVGGGIGGASLAFALAQAGVGVTVHERASAWAPLNPLPASTAKAGQGDRSILQ